MKKIITSLLASILINCFIYAGGDWATSAVNITKDGGESYLYSFNNSNWTNGSWQNNTAYDGFSFGTPTSLILNGAAGNGWTDDTPGYDATSFVLHYRVYKSDATPGEWNQIALDVQAYKNGNNYIYEKSNAAVDLLALATVSGENTYTLEVAMSKNQFYTGGNWNSMIPGGQAVAYSNTVSGYKATFIKSISTDLKSLSRNSTVIIKNNTIEAQFAEIANVELYSSAGQLITKSVATNQFVHSVNRGVYLLRINGEVHKVIVR
jgi:hypothetical protein